MTRPDAGLVECYLFSQSGQHLCGGIIVLDECRSASPDAVSFAFRAMPYSLGRDFDPVDNFALDGPCVVNMRCPPGLTWPWRTFSQSPHVAGDARVNSEGTNTTANSPPTASLWGTKGETAASTPKWAEMKPTAS